MNTAKLDEAVDFYFRRGLANSTQRTYLSAKKRYVQFCTKHDFVPLPVSEQQLSQYIAWLANQGLTHKTLKTYLAAIRHLQIAEGLPDPKIACMPKLDQVMRGIKSHQARTTTGARPRLPITPDILLKLRKVWELNPQNPDNIMLWAAACTCFFGFFRAGEITVPSEMAYDAGAHLNFADVAIDDPKNPTLMRIRLKASKTDPFRNGVDVYLGRTRNQLCPIEAMLAFLAIRGNKQGFLFTFADGRLLTKERFVEGVRQALEKAGVDRRLYSGHSFRSGAATTANVRGLSEATIKMLGRWQSTAYLSYVKTPRDQLARMSSILGHVPQGISINGH